MTSTKEKSDVVLAEDNWTLRPPDVEVRHLPYLHDTVIERGAFDEPRLLRLDLWVPHIDMRLRLLVRGVLGARADAVLSQRMNAVRLESLSFSETLASFEWVRTTIYSAHVLRSAALGEELLDAVLVQSRAPRLTIVCKEVQLVDLDGNPCLDELADRGSAYWKAFAERSAEWREQKARATLASGTEEPVAVRTESKDEPDSET